MGNIQTILMSLGLLSVLLAPGCSNQGASAPAASSGPTYPFFHPDQVKDVFADGNQLPPSLSAKLHACGKLTYDTLGNILKSRGTSLTFDPNAPEGDPARDTAGYLYGTGARTLGAPTYAARVSEGLRNTTGGITRLFDILLAAAQEIIDNMPNQPACQYMGTGATLFDMSGACNADGIRCLLGIPVRDDVVSLCNQMVSDTKVTDVLIRRRLAVAAMASTLYLCD